MPDEGVIPRDRIARAVAGKPERPRPAAVSPREMLAGVEARRERMQRARAAEPDAVPDTSFDRGFEPGSRSATTSGPRIIRPRSMPVSETADFDEDLPRQPLKARKPNPKTRSDKHRSAPKPGSGHGGGGRGGQGGGNTSNSGSGGGGFTPPAFLKRITARHLGYWAAVALLWLGVGTAGLAFTWAMELPETQDLAVPTRAPTVTILANDGTVLARRGSGFARAVGVDELPPHVAHAFVAIEDRRFYSHAGVDPYGIARAMVANFKAMDVVQGGSTITQQLAKNLFLQPDRTLKRKVQETMLALWLESEYTKDELLTLYLNRVYFGAGAYGIEAASQRYFDKPAAEITVPEAAMLAGLVKAPSRLAPTNNPDAAQARANIVIDAMQRYGYLPQAQADTASAFPAELARRATTETGYAVDWIEEQLTDFVGRADRDVTVETTLDPALQVAAVGAVKSGLALVGEAARVSQGALVALSPDGAVLALVGGRSYRDSQFNRATTAQRQPGSAFKTFVYLTAMERGLTPVTIRRDAPVQIANYAPGNYADRYEGDVTLMHALSKSINTVAVRLTHEAGPAAVARTAQRMGITSPLRADLSLALGSSEVTLAELTGAYAPFANGGNGVIAHIINRVLIEAETQPEGDLPPVMEVIYERTGGGPGRVMTHTNVARMNAMLARTISDGTGRRAQIGRPAAGKTGTSQDNRDAWFIGYTADVVAGVWVGNDDGSSMVDVTGGKLPADIWRNFMTAAHTGKAPRDLPGNWQPPVAVAAAPIYDPAILAPPPAGGPAAAPAYDPRFGPPGYTPNGYERRTPDPEPGFFARLFGGN